MTINLVLQSNWQRVSAEVAEACRLAGRESNAVQIVGVSKYVGPELACALAEVGCHTLGENRPQALWEKCEWIAAQANAPTIAWHMIGHLQRNKVKRTLPLIELLHSLDSLRLAQTVSDEAVAAGITVRALVDVNVTDDQTKTGILANELEPFLERAIQLPGLELQGLMAMSSLGGDSDTARREFAHVRQLHGQMSQRFGAQLTGWTELSMGMSGDFHEAIAEGATLVRIGSSLWEGGT
jgi:pyridoxal phosphate enzyme (YggS family)